MGGTWQIGRGGVHSGEPYPTAAERVMLERNGPFAFRDVTVSVRPSRSITDVDDSLWHSRPILCAFVGPATSR
jgi:hypothetical protein